MNPNASTVDPKERAAKTYTTASCFAAYILPHVLFLDDFETRRRVTLTCCLAWNISLSSDPRQREQHIEMLWNMSAQDQTQPPPDGMEAGIKSELRMLVAQKDDLFPHLTSTIPKAELLQGVPYDILSIHTEDDGASEIPLVTHPSPAGLPRILEALCQACEDTHAQAKTLQHAAQQSPDLLKQAMEPPMRTAYCHQRAELRSYHRILTTWQQAQHDADSVSVIQQAVLLLDTIETHSKAVLRIMTEALTA